MIIGSTEYTVALPHNIGPRYSCNPPLLQAEILVALPTLVGS